MGDDAGEVIDEPAVGRGDAQRSIVVHVTLDDLRAQFGERARRGARTRERADLLPALGEQPDEMASEETCCACDERCHTFMSSEPDEADSARSG